MLNEYTKKELETPFYDTYKIKKGDTLYKISKEFDVNTKLLAILNGLDEDDYIYENQLLLIPKKDVSYYVTKEGDTLKTLSDIFDISEEELIKQNKTIYLSKEQMIYFKRD